MTQQSLFGDLPTDDQPRIIKAAGHEGPVVAVAIEDSIDKLLDYAIPSRLINQLAIGQRVRVPLGRGNRAAFGFVVELRERSEFPRVKELLDIEDQRALVTGPIMELARWMSRYYCAPLGTVLDSIIPSAVKKQVGMVYLQMVRLARPREEMQALFEKSRGKRKSILVRLLQVEPGYAIELVRLAGEAGVTPPTVRKLVRLGLITITPEPDLSWAGAQEREAPGGKEGEPAGDGEPAAGAEPAATREQAANGEQPAQSRPEASGEPSAPVLNPDQQRAFDELSQRIAAGGFSSNLLFGVTGSGKTELYLRAIDLVVKRGQRAIVLVPEIALTPQTVRRFTARFARVAILHSGLSASQRHRFWQQCASGLADVVVGARSAVFAPLPDLGIIVIDEEHEPSYKQDQAPRYHARDVGIMRAKMQGVPIILGSATPSLESWLRSGGPQADAGGASQPARTSEHHLLVLPNRVRGLALPTVDLVDMKEDGRTRPRGHIHLFSRRLEALLQKTVEQKHQAILLLNRRGYSNFIYCNSCQEPVHCKYCDATMTYHRTAGAPAHGGTTEEALHTGQLLCHYCLAASPLPAQCPTCGKKLSLFGLGTQRVEEELARKFPGLAYARVDSDAMHSARDYEQILGRFARGDIQVMLGTQMIAKGLDYPNVTLVGVINGDTALSLPDFRAAERTFQLITQVAGRAGRGDAPGRVVVQTFMPDDPAIQAAIRQDFAGFARAELALRRQVGHPPFSRMVRIVLRDQEQEKLQKKSHDLAERVAEAIAGVAGAGEDEGTRGQGDKETGEGTAGRGHEGAGGASGRAGLVSLRGPMPCAISRIAGYYRDQIVLNAPRAEMLQKVLAALRERGHLATSDRIAVDVDPVSLL